MTRADNAYYHWSSVVDTDAHHISPLTLALALTDVQTIASHRVIKQISPCVSYLLSNGGA